MEFRPRPTQYPFFLHKPKPLEFTGVIAHRRGGKSVGYTGARLVPGIAKLLNLEYIPIIGDVEFDYPRFSYFANTKSQARNIIWQYFEKYLSLFKGSKFNSQSMTVTIPRPQFGDYITVALKSGRDHDKVRGERNWEIMLDEYQDFPDLALASLYNTLTDLRGCVYFSGTAKGMDNILYRLIRDLADTGHEMMGDVFYYPVYKTNIIPEDVQQTIRANITREAWLREYELDFTVGYGKSYYSEFVNMLMNDRDRHTEYAPNLPIIVAVDIGQGDSFAAWVAQVQYENRFVILDYYEGYEVLGDFKRDLVNDWGEGAPHFLILPHDRAKRQVSAERITRIKDVFRQVFPPNETKIIGLKRASNLQEDIVNVKESWPIIYMLDQGKHPTDILDGLRKLAQYGPKLNDQGVTIGPVDKSTGVMHCADAFRYLVRGVGVRYGMISGNFGQERVRVSKGGDNATTLWRPRRSAQSNEFDAYGDTRWRHRRI